MKRFILFIICLVSACVMRAQIATYNYILTRTLRDTTGTSYIENIGYYDGLGRPVQTVGKAVLGGSVKQRLFTLTEYDGAGRDSVHWLPVPSTAEFASNDAFKLAAKGGNGYSDSHPYTSFLYDGSMLPDRLLEQYGPGSAWHNAGRALRTERTVNTETGELSCRLYTVTSGGALSGGGTNYSAGQLAVVRSTDEDGNISYTFTDKQGRLLLVRRMEGKNAHDTYSVYDIYDNLRFVLQPMYQTTADLDKYAFQYRYDGRSRCVWKKMPGAQHVIYEYGDTDRPAFSQDGNQRARGTGIRTYYTYDKFGRLTEQGECTGKDVSSNKTVHKHNYYDNYDFIGTPGFTDSRFTADTLGYGKGSLTGSVIAASDGGTKIYVAHYYDIRAREIKCVGNNPLGGYDVTSTTYTFTDKPSTVTHTHTASGKSTRTEVYTYSYDYADRISKLEHTLGGVKVTLASYTYDNIGRLQSKSLHGSATNKLTYAYNVRSWLTGISGTKFTQNLYYNTGNGTARYNGNISSMTWKAGTESTIRGYKFTYDGLDRMLNATYGETAAINTNANRFSENVTGYDKNGNIKSLQRYGQTAASAYGLIDNLTFTLSGNQLTRVDDAVTASAYNNGFEFKDAVKQANEYAYDANGNLTKDLNRNITDIQYNFLNLPSKVTFGDGSTVAYTYAADGTKLRTVHKIGSTTTTTDYCGDVIYENGVQKLLLTEEGYVTLGDSKYHYYLQDHQGNNRVVINQSGTVEETNHYYPFGGVFASSSSVQPYKYNGKEYDNKKGLNWYDYGARHYDAALGIFTTVDPSAENYYPTSPYAYCGGDPINRIDPTGTDWYKDGEGNFHWVERGSDISEGWTWVGPSVSIELGKDRYASYYENGGIITNKPVDTFDLIASSPKLQNLFLGKNSLLSEASKSRLFNGLVSREVDAIARPIGEAIVWSGAGEVGGFWIGKAISWGYRGTTALLGKAVGETVNVASQMAPITPVIEGFTQHGMHQMITRGFKVSDVLKIVKEGIPTKAMGRYGPQTRYKLNGNTVVINDKGKIVSVFSNFPGTRNQLGRGIINPF